jgi:hypothetical protein
MPWGRFPGLCATLAAVVAAASCSCDPTECNSDNDCGDGQLCDGYGKCTAPECRGDAECGPGRICTLASYECTPGCRFDSDCRPGLVCSSDVRNAAGAKQCIRGCSSDTQCGAGEICAGDGCTAGCRTNADCPLRTFCTPALTCSAGCHDDAECGSEQICSDGTCLDSCSLTRSCKDGAMCAALDAFGAVLRSSPSSPSPCHVGYRCLCIGNPTSRHLDGGTNDSGARSVDAGRDASDARADAKPPHDAGIDAARGPDARATKDAGDGGTRP